MTAVVIAGRISCLHYNKALLLCHDPEATCTSVHCGLVKQVPENICHYLHRYLPSITLVSVVIVISQSQQHFFVIRRHYLLGNQLKAFICLSI